MTRADKLIARFQSLPADFTWDELTRLLEALGYQEVKAGKTGGSRRRFIHPQGVPVLLHKPHPGNIVKLYVLRQLMKQFKDEGLL